MKPLEPGAEAPTMEWECFHCTLKHHKPPLTEVQCLTCGLFLRTCYCTEPAGLLAAHTDKNREDHCPGRMPRNRLHYVKETSK